MRGAPRVLRGRWALLAVLAAVAVALAPQEVVARTRTARASLERRFQQAESRFRSLTESPTARRRPELWDQAAERFRAIVSANAAGARADDACYLLAEVWHERFHQFHRDGDLDRAIEAYEDFLARYPRSPYADDALVQLGEIHYYQLGDPDQALRFYRRAIRDYPDGDLTAQARARADAIEGRSARPRASVDTNEPTVGGSDSLSRPLLSSPGAVIGGRTGSRVPAALLPRTIPREEPETGPGGEGGNEATAPPPAVRRETAAPPPIPEVPVEPEPSPEPAPLPRASAPAPAQPGAAAPASPRLLNPLLEEGPIPLRTPADPLPRLSPSGPRSRTEVLPGSPRPAMTVPVTKDS